MLLKMLKQLRARRRTQLIEEVAQNLRQSVVTELAQEVDFGLVASHLDVSEVSAYVCTSEVADYVDICPSEVAWHMDMCDVAEYVDKEEVASYISVDAENVADCFSPDDIAGYIPVSDIAPYIRYGEVVCHLDYSQIAENIHASLLYEELDIHELAQHVVNRLDIEPMIETIINRVLLSGDLALDITENVFNEVSMRIKEAL